MCEGTDSRCTTTATVRETRLAGGSSRFLCLSFFAAAKKVSAAPHRGNANRPLTNQGKAKALRTQTNKHRRQKTPRDAHFIQNPCKKMARLPRQRPPARRAASDRRQDGTIPRP